VTLEESLRTAIAEAVAAGLAGPLADLRAVVEASTRNVANATEARTDDELARILRMPYLEAREAAKLLRVGREEIYRLVNAGSLNATRFGRKLVFSREELDQFMAQHEHHAPVQMTPDARRRLTNAPS
jgi:excisionase family DNA binding protein